MDVTQEQLSKAPACVRHHIQAFVRGLTIISSRWAESFLGLQCLPRAYPASWGCTLLASGVEQGWVTWLSATRVHLTWRQCLSLISEVDPLLLLHGELGSEVLILYFVVLKWSNIENYQKHKKENEYRSYRSQRIVGYFWCLYFYFSLFLSLLTCTHTHTQNGLLYPYCTISRIFI